MATAKKKQEFAEDMIEGSDAEDEITDSWNILKSVRDSNSRT